jgi:hypothetical protein
MPFSDAPYDRPLRNKMTAALELAWLAVGSEVQGLLPVDRANMNLAILNAVAIGERDFKLLQQRAIEALASRGVKSATPIERRQCIRLVGGSEDRRRS